MKVCDYKDCTGCFACMNICPKNAISPETDSLGKTIPRINDKLCIECNLCRKKCPSNEDVLFSRSEIAIAAISNDNKDRELSSSGGVASVLAKNTIMNDGIVFAAVSMEGEVKHILIDKLEMIDIMRGSKYVQSFIGYTYRDVKHFLDEKRNVLFIGTPCQIAGLKKYLGRDYLNLLTVDLICHGTPPEKYLEEYINDITKKKWDKVSFRGKYDWNFTVENNKDIIYKEYKESDLYFKAFLEGLIFRDNCYDCRYACPERVSDITIGDFWGLNKQRNTNEFKGNVSLVLLNTEKGKKSWKINQESFIWEIRSFDEVYNPYQTNLIRPSIPHPEREKFKKNYHKRGFTSAVQHTNLGKQVKLQCIKNEIKELPVFKAILNK